MAVTFTAALVDATAYVVACCTSAADHARRLATYEDALSALADAELAHLVSGADRRAPRPGCELPDVCPDYPLDVRPVYVDPAPEVNVHGGTALRLVEALGYPIPAEGQFGDMSGDASPEEFTGRVLMALAVAPADAGMPAYEDTRPGGQRWFEGGRRPGHLRERLVELHTLADWCQSRGRRVQWI